MYCPECGSRLEDGLKFCTECGTPIKAKPDFEQQTAYRIETFAQGPGQTPNPDEPLPVQDQKPDDRHDDGVVADKPGGAETVDAKAAPHAGDTPVSGSSDSAKATHAGTSQFPNAPKQQGEQKPKRTGCLIVVIILAIGILLLAGACSVLDRCSSESPITTGGTTSGAGANQSSTNAHSPASAARDTNDSWTVLLYLCGSDLESDGGLATYNLQELTSTRLGGDVTFAIETGGTTQWQNSTVSARHLTRYSYSSAGFFEEQRLSAASMATEATFADFVSWGVKTFPADHYMLVMWDHGGGSVYGVCNDELFPYTSSYENDTLTLTEMTGGLDKAGVKFDVIGFDTCLMATYETADHLTPYADYLVASEEIEPGSGWDWAAWPAWLSKHKGASGDQLGAEICDTYYAKCKLYKAADMATLSVIDLSKIDALSDSFYGASREIAMATGDKKALRTLYYASLEATCFGGDPAYNMVDLGDLMRKTKGVVSEYSEDVIAGINDAVVYQVHGRSHPSVTGMSVFYPLDTSYKPEFYGFLDVAGNIPYAQFTAVMFGLYNSVDWAAYNTAVTPKSAPVVEEGISLDYTERVNDDGRLEITITEGLDNLAQIAIQVSALLPDDRAVVYLGTDYNVIGDWDAGVFADNFFGRWMAIDGNWVSTTLYEVGDGYNMYYIPVLLNGEPSNLIARYDLSTKEYEIVCACAVIDETSLAPKEMRALEDGDELEFRFSGYTLDDDQEVAFEFGSVTWSDDVKVGEVDLGEGAFLFRYVLTDVLGEEHMTDLYVQNYEGDTITVETLSDYLKRTNFTM